MKSSILFSGLTTFCLLIAFGVSPSKSSYNRNYSAVSHVKTTSVKRLFIASSDNETQLSKNQVILKVPSALQEDFSYLKFDVSSFTDSAEVSTYETMELPFNAFDYLKFKVDDYLGTNPDSNEILELPSDNFNYLKFDVNTYIGGTELETDANMELPSQE
jgi:hypothetical protein